MHTEHSYTQNFKRKKSISPFDQASCSRVVGDMVRPVDSMSAGPLATCWAEKWQVPWLGADGIPWWWIRHFVSPWVIKQDRKIHRYSSKENTLYFPSATYHEVNSCHLRDRCHNLYQSSLDEQTWEWRFIRLGSPAMVVVESVSRAVSAVPARYWSVKDSWGTAGLQFVLEALRNGF